MPTYNKPFLDLQQQLNRLKQRGLEVRNNAEALECLHRNGYYRLSASWYPFRQPVPSSNPPQRKDQFLSGSVFEDAMALYRFDKAFKLLLLDALEQIEIAARVEIALRLGAQDPFAYANPTLLHSDFLLPTRNGQSKYQNWHDKFDNAVLRSRDEFVIHYKKKYVTQANLPMQLPIWMAIELWDFGMLSHIYGGLKVLDQRAIALRFSVPSEPLMGSWLRSLNYVRNVIAHHGRLWNIGLVDRPKLPSRGFMSDFDHLTFDPRANRRIYSICCILSHFSRATNSQSPWPQQLASLVANFPTMPYAQVGDMGFPTNWQANNLWN